MDLGLPYSTRDLPAVPGTIKARYEDFQVDEIPAYEPSGEGDHVYFVMEKQGLATPRAVADIARALRVSTAAIGVAGLKDARSVSRQMLSLERGDEQAIRNLSIPRIRILSVSRHRNKLRTGHLKGNRFAIRLRDTEPERIGDVRACLARLEARGAPNYFGPQRFGNRGDTGTIGEALLKGDFPAAARHIAGAASDKDTGEVLRARELFDAGRYEEAAGAWPRGFGECAALCRNMARGRGNARRAVLDLSRQALGLYVSAIQSSLFNEALTARIDRFDALEAGDVAWKHASGAVFLVEDLAAEAPRAERFEISPTGPLFGERMKPAAGAVAEREAELLEARGLSLASFPDKGPLRTAGGRRPFRFRPEGASAEAGADEHGPYLELRFSLPSGCYATAVLREICKDRLVQTEM